MFRHSWVFLIVAMSANAFIWWYRGREIRDQYPERVSSYKRLLVWMLVVGNIPWLILGGGVLFGDFISPLDPIILSETNAWGWAFWLYIPVWSIGLVVYVFLFDGAEELSKHPGLINLPINRETPNIWRTVTLALLALHAATLPVVWMNKGNPAFAYQEWMMPETVEKE